MYLAKDNRNKAIAHIRSLGSQLEFLRPDGVGVTQGGADKAFEDALAHFDQHGSIDVIQLGKIVEHVKQQYPQFRADIPHLAEFPECYTIEKATEYIKKNSRKIPGTQIVKLNELLKFLQDNDIHSDASAEPQETPEQTEQREGYAAIRERVSKLTNRDCGNVGSGPGMSGWDRVNNFKRRHFTYVDECEKRNISAASVRERIEADIREFQSTSIR